jgi:hypothetical protein
MPNHLSDIDVTLEGIQSRTAHLATQLFELDGERERRAAEVDGLRGTTAAAWQRAADQIAVMWAWYQALSESVASMAARRQGRGLDPVQADALWTALTGRSVVIPPESMEVARRCLPGQTAAASTWAIDPLSASCRMSWRAPPKPSRPCLWSATWV